MLIKDLDSSERKLALETQREHSVWNKEKRKKSGGKSNGKCE